MLELARRLHPDLEFREGDATALDFEDESFDVVVGAFLMPHLSDLPARGARVRPRHAARRPGGAHHLGRAPADALRGRHDGGGRRGGREACPTSCPPARRSSSTRPTASSRSSCWARGSRTRSSSRIAFTHHVDDLDEFWADVLGGTVRTMTMVTSQPPELQAEIRRRYDELLEPYRTGRRLGHPLLGQARLGAEAGVAARAGHPSITCGARDYPLSPWSAPTSSRTACTSRSTARSFASSSSST